MNWVEHLQATGCEAFIVGAMDDKLLEFLLDKKVPTFSMSSGLSLGDFGWGSPTFHKMGREKINLLHSFTKMGFDVLISDVDTVWLRNPLPYMKQYPDADILTSSDHLSNTVTDEGLELWPQAASAANIGIMLFRPRANALAKVREVQTVHAVLAVGWPGDCHDWFVRLMHAFKACCVRYCTGVESHR
jgi:hypothetical protein